MGQNTSMGLQFGQLPKGCLAALPGEQALVHDRFRQGAMSSTVQKGPEHEDQTFGLSLDGGEVGGEVGGVSFGHEGIRRGIRRVCPDEPVDQV